MASRYLNSKEVANVLGVNVSTIKRWTDAGKLESIRTPGGHRKFLLRHLSKFMKENQAVSKKANLLNYSSLPDRTVVNTQKAEYAKLTEEFIASTIHSDGLKVQTVLMNLYLAQRPLAEIFDNLVKPVLHQIGELWENGKISASEEHVASDRIRDALINLRSLITRKSAPDTVALLVSLENEYHDLVLKMIQLILEDRGFGTLNSGANTPLQSLIDLINKAEPDRIYISSTYVSAKEQQDAQLQQLFDLCLRQQIRIFVGGAGFNELNHEHPSVEKRLFTFADVAGN